jgi:hypothetical protein
VDDRGAKLTGAQRNVLVDIVDLNVDEAKANFQDLYCGELPFDLRDNAFRKVLEALARRGLIVLAWKGPYVEVTVTPAGKAASK